MLQRAPCDAGTANLTVSAPQGADGGGHCRLVSEVSCKGRQGLALCFVGGDACIVPQRPNDTARPQRRAKTPALHCGRKRVPPCKQRVPPCKRQPPAIPAGGQFPHCSGNLAAARTLRADESIGPCGVPYGRDSLRDSRQPSAMRSPAPARKAGDRRSLVLFFVPCPAPHSCNSFAILCITLELDGIFMRSLPRRRG